MEKHVINPESPKRTVGEHIKFLRTSTGKTQSQLAKRLNVQQSFLSAVERGERKMPEAWHIELSQEFGSGFSDYITKSDRAESVLIERTNSRTNGQSKKPLLPVQQPPTVFISHAHQAKPSPVQIAAQFDVEPIQRMFEAAGDPYGRDAWSAEYVLDLQQNQRWLSIDRQLERVLGRLLRVEELLEDLVGLRFDDARYNALRKEIIQPPTFDLDGVSTNATAGMSPAQMRSYYANRERLLEQCETNLSYLLNTLHESITHPANLDHSPLKGSAGEALRPFLNQRYRERYSEAESE